MLRLLLLVSIALVVLGACGGEADAPTTDPPPAEPEPTESTPVEAMEEVLTPTEEPEPTPEPTATPEPTPQSTATPEPTAAPEPSIGQTRENPIPFGETGTLMNWEIRVLETTPNANEIFAQNQSNDPPAEGHQFYLVRIEATYIGDGSSTLPLDLTMKAVDDANVVYEGTDAYCGSMPDDDSIMSTGEVFSGGTIETNVCWSVRSDGIDSLIMIVDAWLSLQGERLFFALQNE